MKSFTAVVERDPDTGYLVGYVPGFPGAHSQAQSLDELQANLREVIAMLLKMANRGCKPNSWAPKALRSLTDGFRAGPQARRGVPVARKAGFFRRASVRFSHPIPPCGRTWHHGSHAQRSQHCAVTFTADCPRHRFDSGEICPAEPLTALPYTFPRGCLSCGVVLFIAIKRRGTKLPCWQPPHSVE